MNADKSRNSRDEQALYLSVLEDFLYSNVGAEPIDELWASSATEELDLDTSPLDGDEELSCIVTVPEVTNNSALQARTIGPSMIGIPDGNHFLGIEQVSVYSNDFNYSMTSQHPTATLPSTEETQRMQMINYCSPQLPEVVHTKESLSYQNTSCYPSQYQSSQEEQMWQSSTVKPISREITLPQQSSSNSSNIGYKLEYANSIRNPSMTMLPCLPSVVESGIAGTVANSDQQLQNTEDLYRFEPETSLVTAVQVRPFKSIQSTYQQNTNNLENSIKNNVMQDNRSLGWQQGSEQPNILNILEKTFQCSLCQKIFETYFDWNKHCCDESPYKCEKCPSKFRHICKLNAHCRTHHGEKRFTCNECQKTFIREDILKRHYLIHISKKPFGCNVCHRKFRQKTALNRHYCQPTSNTGEKPFECAF